MYLSRAMIKYATLGFTWNFGFDPQRLFVCQFIDGRLPIHCVSYVSVIPVGNGGRCQGPLLDLTPPPIRRPALQI